MLYPLSYGGQTGVHCSTFCNRCRADAPRLPRMTHMHVAGSIHADAVTPAPKWLHYPEDVNALVQRLWSTTVRRDDDGVMQVGGVPLPQIAEEVGTPAFVIDEVDFRQRMTAWRDAFAATGTEPGMTVYYAGKSFLCGTVVDWVATDGLNLDVCSHEELQLALAAGFDASRIGLHGNNKSEAELETAVTAGVGRIVVDSVMEIERLDRIARAHGRQAPVLVRVTAGVEAHTHEYISTAHEDQKFGLGIESGAASDALVRCEDASGIELRGIHSHIGSQIFDTSAFEVSTRRTLRLAAEVAERIGRLLPELDLGGGFGIAYTTVDAPMEPADIAGRLRAIVVHECRALDLAVPDLSIEPGRAISGPAGLSLYTVGTVKPVLLGEGMYRLYISVDGGMSDNIRPALYGADYSGTIANRASGAEPTLGRVVGRHCESGDILIRDEFFPRDVAPSDLVAIPGTGAYSREMASNYNHVTRPPVVAVRDGRIRTLIRRETLDDLFALDPVLVERRKC